MYRYKILSLFFLCWYGQQIFSSQDRALRLARGESVDFIYNFQTNISIFIEQCNFLPQLQTGVQLLHEISDHRESFCWEHSYLTYDEDELTIKEPFDVLKPLFVLCDHVDQHTMIQLMAPVVAVCVLDLLDQIIEN